MLKRLALMAVLSAAVAVVAVQAAAAAPVAKTFVFCSDISYPPEEFVQSGKNLGSDIDIGTRRREAARHVREVPEHGLRRHRRGAPFEQVRRDHQRHERHAGPAEERRVRRLPQRRPVAHREEGQPAEDQHDPIDVCGRVAGAQVATTNLETLQKFDKQCKAKGKKGIKIISFKEDPLGVIALKTGHLDVYESDSPPAVWYTTKDKSLQIVGQADHSRSRSGSPSIRRTPRSRRRSRRRSTPCTRAGRWRRS